MRRVPSFFFPSIYGRPKPAQSTRAINRWGKKRGSVTYSTDREDEISKIFTIYVMCLTGSERFLFMGNGFKFLKGSKSNTTDALNDDEVNILFTKYLH